MIFRCALRWISVILLFSTGGNLFAQQTKKVSPAGTKYLLYTPPGYNPSQTYPLLIVLHGQGGMGDNLDLLLNKDEIPSKLIHQNRWPSRYPFIVVSPQLKRDPSVPDPADQLWPPQMVDEVVEHVRSGYAVNPNKIYITGLSQGAHGSYDYTTAFPSKIAAAAYISGVPDSTKACLVKDIPIWIFHGTDDSLVPPVFAYGLERNLKECRGKYRPHLNMLYGRRHEGWNEIYNNSNGYNIFDWMLKFTKNNPANTPPYANAGADLTIATRQQPLHVYGEFFDSDGEVATVRWTKVSGPAVTMAETDSRFLKLTDLTPGQFEFELTVTDDDGARTSDRVRITIVANNSVSPAVTGLTLLDGTGTVLETSLYDGYVIDPTDIGRRGVNLRAHVSGAVGSVQYRINSNANARTSDNSASDFPLASPRWTLNEEEYLVCATPFTGAGATGSAGASQCFKIIFSATATPPPPPTEEPPAEEPPVEEPPVEEPPVEEPPVEEPPVEEPPVEEPPVEEPPVEEPPVEEPPVEEPPVEEPPVEEPPVEEPPVEEPPVEEPPVEQPPVAPTVFYAKPGADISQLASWSSNPTGTGTAPASFTTNGQTFEVRSEAVLNNPLAIGGTNSVLRIVSGGKLTLNNRLQSPVNLQGQSTLHVATEEVPTFGTLDPQSTVTFAANATIPASVYGNLIMSGNGTVKNLQPGVTAAKGMFTLADGVKVEGSANGSTLVLSGADVTGVYSMLGFPIEKTTIIGSRYI
jgi:predicted esterase